VESKVAESFKQSCSCRGKRVLIADESSTSRDLLRSILEGCGYEVVEAESGEEALALAAEVAPDAMVVDLQMAEVHRWMADEELWRNPELRCRPVVAMAGAAMEVSAEQMAAAGFAGYLVKPIGPRRLRSCLEGLV
jgi:CheY-like chemotaxis protein